MMNIVYVGYVAPSEDVYRVQTSFAGNDAEINFVTRILAKMSDVNNLYVCSYAYNIYHANKRHYKKSGRFELKHLDTPVVECTALAIFDLPGLRQLLAPISAFVYLFRTVKEIKRKSKDELLLITSNTFPMFSYPSIIIRKLFGCKLVSYQIDGFYEMDSKSDVRRMNVGMAIHAFQKYDAAIALCHNVLKDFAVEGQKTMSITPVDTAEESEGHNLRGQGDKFRLFFAGGIAPLNGILECVKAMEYLDDSYEFTFYGRGELQDYLTDAAERDGRIHYKGAVSKDQIVKLEMQNDVLFIIRPMENEQQNYITKYGLPYKLIEYMQSGTPIIASHMLAIPDKFDRFINYCGTNPEEVAMCIENVRENYLECLEKATRARQYMKDDCSWEKYLLKVGEFLHGI